MSEKIQGLDQTDYMKLFMQELTYQDPLKPMDNKEFMAHMAQFSALEEAKNTNESLASLLGMTVGSQSLSLLGKEVKIRDSNEFGKVTRVEFFSNAPPLLSVANKKGETKVELAQINEVIS